ncbi:S46 family peptidase [uncultured Paludibaculum sp.]|uniref:S46 family peptidase n=1 Tax=uncultured Paludibaculum sp. TaxID=1765020 RepID=UPI002AAB8B5A|nr:S46 family peptidase [uncultured Paludibaculum sp.]
MTRTWTNWSVCLTLTAAMATAGEGKWTPQQVLQLDPLQLRKEGLQLPVSRLWDQKRGTGLLAAAVNIGGCSAGFVSATGLILTNHHCLFGILQEHSRPGRDLITDGFLAKSLEEELPGRTTRVSVPRKFTDVTKEIEAAVPAGAGDLARNAAIEGKQKVLVSECEKTPGARCKVAVFDGGLQYVLIDSFELSDIRLVYAPPRAIGEYGGEIDNWMWPRHTGDFAMARAYKDGKPYKPEFYFPLSTTGVKTGDFVMVLGYPGRTVRSLTAAEMAVQRDQWFRLRAEVYGEWLNLLETTTKGSEEGTIAVAATQKSLANVSKNAQGQLAGLKRGGIIEKQAKSEDAVEAWIGTHSQYAKAAEAKQELDRMAVEKRKTGNRDFLFNAIQISPLALKFAANLVRLAEERTKPDMERDPDYMEREWTRLRATMERDQKSFYRPADQALFASLVAHAMKLGPQERIEAFDKIFGDGKVDETLGFLYGRTKVLDLKERMKMFNESTEELKARKDPLLGLAFALEPELRAWRTKTHTLDGAVARLRPEWRKAVIAHAGKPVAPDANSTLRVSFAHVKGYAPRDGVIYTPQTTLAGMLEKETGEEPFKLPEKAMAAAAKVDAAKVPLDFLADADTTGGNSGSPTVNGRGELVGLNFDRVWENVANDFGYNPDVARNVNVDIRFFLWLLKDVDHADGILKELGVASK